MGYFAIFEGAGENLLIGYGLVAGPNGAADNLGIHAYDADLETAKLNVRIDAHSTIDFRIETNGPGLENPFRALDMVRNANVAPGNIDRASLAWSLGIDAMNDLPDKLGGLDLAERRHGHRLRRLVQHQDHHHGEQIIRGADPDPPVGAGSTP